jgi:hypothetical protein
MPWVTRNDQPATKPNVRPNPAPTPKKSDAAKTAPPTPINPNPPAIEPATPKQTPALSRAEISRLNGAKSQGPTTLEGKARSSQNACKHGMYAKKQVLVPLDDAEEFDAFRTAVHEHFVPTDPIQTTLVERIVVAAWRLRRAIGAESSDMDHHSRPTAYYHGPAERMTFFASPSGYIQLTRYEAGVERSLYQALGALAALQNANKAKIAETNPF